MAITEGTYVIVNANSGLALDVCGASDASGANVWQWTVNRGDAQIWAISERDGGWTATCSLTGKLLDVSRGTMADGTNVQQWGDNGSDAQRWAIEADGKTMTFGGESLETYVISCAASASFVLDVSAGGKTAGANVQIWTANGSDAQRWGFVPVACMGDGGTYSIRSALADDLALDVSGGSMSNGANVQVWGANGTNAQVWEALVDEGSGLVSFVRPDCGKALDCNGASADGTNVHQWDYGPSNENQRWLLVKHGTTFVNGVSVPTYAVHAQASSGRVLDVAGGSSAPAANVQTWGYNGTKAQLFWLEPTSWLASNISAPTVAGVSASATSYSRGGMEVTEATDAYICVYSAGPQVKVRYRTVSYAWGNRSDAKTSQWMSAVDGDPSHDGWGDAWQGYPCTGRVTLPHAITCDIASGAYDRVDIEVEAVSFNSSWGSLAATARSAVSSRTFTVCYRPTVSAKSVTMSGDGAVVRLTSDAPTVGNTYEATVYGGTGSSLGTSEATITVPWSGLMEMPKDGETVTIRARLTTPDTSITSYVTASMSYASGTSVTISSSTLEQERQEVRLVLSASPSNVWLAWECGEGVRFEKVEHSGNVAVVAPPFGRDWWVIVQLGSAFKTFACAQVQPGAFVWTWDGSSARMRGGIGSAPKQSRKWSSSTSTSSANGRVLRMVRAWGVRTHVLSVSGACPSDDEELDMADGAGRFRLMSRLLGEGKYPLYRTPYGDRERVAVTNVTVTPAAKRWCECTVTQEAVDLGD